VAPTWEVNAWLPLGQFINYPLTPFVDPGQPCLSALASVTKFAFVLRVLRLRPSASQPLVSKAFVRPASPSGEVGRCGCFLRIAGALEIRFSQETARFSLRAASTASRSSEAHPLRGSHSHVAACRSQAKSNLSENVRQPCFRLARPLSVSYPIRPEKCVCESGPVFSSLLLSLFFGREGGRGEARGCLTRQLPG